MNKYVPEILLWLFVINLGIAYCAGLYEKEDHSSPVVQQVGRM